MAVMNINPTRMQLTRLKQKLRVAMRGHKLLKDKRDELMRQFLDIVRDNKDLRKKVETQIENINSHFVQARAFMLKEEFIEAIMLPKQSLEINIEEKNIMSVSITHFNSQVKGAVDAYSYGYAFTSYDLDEGVRKLTQSVPDILKLAESENSIMLLASEIEKTRRRVNALEHIMIPDLKDTIRYITMKLDENERSSQTRLMKVKDMMIKDKFEKTRQ